jgi:type IV secretory pathway VirB3-like protein
MYDFINSLINTIFILLNVIMILFALFEFINTNDYVMILLILLCMVFIFNEQIKDFLIERFKK